MTIKIHAWTGRAAIVGLLLCLGTAWGDARDQFNGVWRIEKPVFALRTDAGKAPPLQPEAEKSYREHRAARAAGDTSFDSATWCSSLGYPRALLVNYPFEIIVRPQHVVFLHEWNWWHRIVYLDGALSDQDASVGPAGITVDVPGAVKVKPQDIPGSMGTALGKWEGDTLVVNTSNLIETTLLDSAGMPHSDELKLTEKWRLRSPNVLESRIRFDDPATFTQPWETVITFKRQAKTWQEEDVCLDRIKAGQPAVKETMK